MVRCALVENGRMENGRLAPVAGSDEGGPVEGMSAQATGSSAVEHLHIGMSDGVCRAQLC